MRSTTGRLLGMCAVVTLTAACGSSASNSGSAPSGSSGQSGKVQQLSVVLPHANIFTVGLPYAVAQKQGFFARQGLSVTSIFTAGGGANVQAVLAGSANIGVETGPGALFAAAANGAPVRIFSASTNGLDILLFSKAGSAFTDPASLSGQKVGYSEPGSSSQVIVNALNKQLQAQGKAPAIGQALGGPPQQLAAVTTGQVAAGWTIPPTFLDKVKAGTLQIAVNGFRDMPEYRHIVGRVQFTTADFLKQHPDEIRGFVTAWQEAWDWAFAHEDQAIKIWQDQANVQGDPAALKQAFTYYQRDMFAAVPIDGIDVNLENSVAAGGKNLSPQQLKELVDTSATPHS